jgi:peptidoglycan LD-endopeptidase CwlK
MPKFGKASRDNLAEAHPLLQKLFNEVIKETDCKVLDAQRGKAAQEEAFRKGHSRAHFGQSPHNYSPSIALDVVPWPLNWKDTESFKRLAAVVKAKAKALKIPITWGGDWKSLVDMPHYELKPWRTFAAKARPYTGKKASAKGKLLDTEAVAVTSIASSQPAHAGAKGAAIAAATGGSMWGLITSGTAMWILAVVIIAAFFACLVAFPEFRKTMNGWKTRIFAFITMLLGAAEWLDPAMISQALGLDDQGRAVTVIAIGLGILLLREVTSKPGALVKK